MNARSSPGAQHAPRSTRASMARRSWLSPTALLGLLLGVGLAYLYVTYLRSDDVAPDSVYGYGFAITGTALLTLVGLGYVARKRLKRNWSGMLHSALTWHALGGVLGLALILMHAAGNFHPRTGTYALYGLLALVVSGLIGRLLDRVAPRLAAQAALATLTPEGDERLDALAQSLRAGRRTRHQRRQPANATAESGAPWDLAFYDLTAQPAEIPGLLNSGEAGSSRQRQRPAPAAQPPSALAAQSAQIRDAIGRERLYLQLIRVWRRLHTLISLVTLGLILWHLEFAATLLINAR